MRSRGVTAVIRTWKRGRHRFVNLLERDDRYGENKPRLSLCRMLWRAASTLWRLLTSAATLHQNASLSHGGYHRSQGSTINQALARLRVRLDLEPNVTTRVGSYPQQMEQRLNGFRSCRACYGRLHWQWHLRSTSFDGLSSSCRRFHQSHHVPLAWKVNIHRQAPRTSCQRTAEKRCDV